ncbi:hypothetical protein AB2B41_14380 [Marimonas sp. MJW-29]|uniref:Lipoprotein n=1 Tax=Sulfitobacter sediminis TaxID=3234186 RepID=A0ABV3RP93_9RHOB
MKPSLRACFAALALLAACAPVETYYKPGVAVDRLNRDTTACEVKALRDVPVTTLTRPRPPIFVPGNRVCDADGNCRGHRGYYIHGGYETYDPNLGLRLRVERQCMADKGYVPVSIPVCPDTVARAVPPRATTRMPTLTERSCVIRNRDGSFQIVTRG